MHASSENTNSAGTLRCSDIPDGSGGENGAHHRASPHSSGEARATGDLERAEATALRAFDSDEWIQRAARAAEAVVLGEMAGYRIRRVVQRGAQGTVYEATEGRSGRLVAIKRLANGELGTLEADRFSRETSALASLGHPNVVALLAAPEADGARLIVMEWIDGVPLDTWSDTAWLQHTPREAVRAIAECHAKVASAIAAAHARGIMHRDLKPSNVLVTAGGEPKVLDFGLVKELGASRDITRTNGFAGTPSWSSPEQVAGNPHDIDARADVHALGLLLYRALSGGTAFDASLGIGPLFESIRACVPFAPSRTRFGVPRELDLITLRALEKDPARRYQTADAFERDLNRYLNGEAIDAHPPNIGYLLRKFFGRHRALTVAFGIASTAVFGGAVVSAIFAIDATSARNAAIDRADEAEHSRARAERMNVFFAELLANLRERDVAGERTSAKEIIMLAASSLERGDTPQDSESDLRSSLGAALYEIGDYDGSLHQYLRASELLATTQDQAEHARVLARAMTSAKRATSLPPKISALSLARACATIRESINASADLIAEPYEMIALSCSDLGQLRDARDAADHARELAERSGNALALANAVTTDSLILQAEGRALDASDSAIDAVNRARSIPGLKPPQLARFLHNAGYLLNECGRAREALPYLEESIALRVGFYGTRHPALNSPRAQLALTLRALGRFDESIALLESVLESYPASPGIANPNRGNMLRHLGRIYQVRQSDGDSLRALHALRAASFELAASGFAHYTRFQSAMKFFLRELEQREGHQALEAQLATMPDELARHSNSPTMAIFARLWLVSALATSQSTTSFSANQALIALLRADLDCAAKEFGPDSMPALDVELGLAQMLATIANSDAKAESVRRIEAVYSRASLSLGATSGPARTAAALLPKSP